MPDEPEMIRGAVTLDIEDDGIGVSREQLDQVAKPFYSSTSNGTGLGLPFAREIAASHGGQLVMLSGTGQGTRVTFRMPGTHAATFTVTP